MVQQLSLAILAPLRVDMAVSNKQIYPTIVIIVKKLRSPANIRETHLCDLCLERNIGKRIAPIIAIQSVVLVVEISYEEIQLAVMVVVTQRNAHRPLLTAALIYSCTGNKSDLLKCAVTVVMIEEVWRRIIGDKNIDQPVFIKIAANNSQAIVAVGV